MTRRLLTGNAAVARGLYEAGCRFVASYPGTPATEIAEEAARLEGVYAQWSVNEKTALEAAIGASLAGSRALCAMKHVGLNVCADALFSASYVTLNAGLVIAVADDPGMHSSQNEEDTRHYAIAAKLPMLEPSDAAECRDMTLRAFELSERLSTPVLLRLCTRLCHTSAPVALREPVSCPQRDYVPLPDRRVVVPANARRMHERVEARARALEALAEEIDLTREEHRSAGLGIVTSGTCYLYVRECFPEASVLKLGMVSPLPTERLRRFAGRVEKLYVIEEEDGIIERHLRACGLRVDAGKDRTGLTGELSPDRLRKAFELPIPPHAEPIPELPARPPVLCPGCPHRALFHVLGRLRLTVLGDIGCYTLGYAPPLSAMDTALCMGASVGMLHGFTKARPEAAASTVAVIGDSTLLHSGMAALADLVYNGGCGTVIVADNGTTAMTGHQPNPATGRTLMGAPAPRVDLEALCRALGLHRVCAVDPPDIEALEDALRRELACPEPSVIIARHPCALRQGPPTARLTLEPERCTGCGECLSVGCPALSLHDGLARPDSELCTGCGLCARLCPTGALRREALRP